MFGHRDHLNLAWGLIREHGCEPAIPLMAQAIRDRAAAHGQTGKFHATLTTVWVRLVAAHVAFHHSDEFDEFIARNAALLDKDLPLRFYSLERLFSASAREAWVEPDREPLPAG